MSNPNIIYKPTEKARQVFRAVKKSKYILLEGAVRSAKSFTADDIAIKRLQELPAGDVLVSGYSSGSVARNVLSSWKKIIDPNNLGLFKMVKEGKDEFLTINWRGLRNKKFYVRGAGKSNDWMQIQGATFIYWYADELTRHCESFLTMAQTRLSKAESEGIWTTNPDHPRHYVKRTLIDDEKKRKPIVEGARALLQVFTFYLTDNPSLSRSVVEELSNSYVGFFKRRYIHSQWVAAEGAIYGLFDESKHVVPYIKLPEAKQKIVSIDYGTANPASFGLYGVNLHEKTKAWRERAYYYDSRDPENGGRQKTDSELADDLFEFIEGEDVSMIIVDPSALSFKTELRKQMGVRKKYIMLRDANNSVLDGIRTQATMLHLGEYVLSDHPSNEQCIEDYGAYLWDEKACERGEDKPIKENDHTKDEERYFLFTVFGNKKPMDYESFVEE